MGHGFYHLLWKPLCQWDEDSPAGFCADLTLWPSSSLSCSTPACFTPSIRQASMPQSCVDGCTGMWQWQTAFSPLCSLTPSAGFPYFWSKSFPCWKLRYQCLGCHPVHRQPASLERWNFYGAIGRDRSDSDRTTRASPALLSTRIPQGLLSAIAATLTDIYFRHRWQV